MGILLIRYIWIVSSLIFVSAFHVVGSLKIHVSGILRHLGHLYRVLRWCLSYLNYWIKIARFRKEINNENFSRIEVDWMYCLCHTVRVILPRWYYEGHTVWLILLGSYCMNHTVRIILYESHCMSHMNHTMWVIWITLYESYCLNHTVWVIMYE